MGGRPNTPPKFNSSPLKNDGWKTIHSYWVLVTFQGRTVKLREGTRSSKSLPSKHKNPSFRGWNAGEKTSKPTFDFLIRWALGLVFWIGICAGLVIWTNTPSTKIKGAIKIRSDEVQRFQKHVTVMRTKKSILAFMILQTYSCYLDLRMFDAWKQVPNILSQMVV